jgi:hypothetical protein
MLRGLVWLLASAATMLPGCEAVPDEASAIHGSGVATIAPSSLVGGISVELLHLEPRDTTPGACGPGVYGSIAAAHDASICVCQPQAAAHHDAWVQIGSRQPCWSENQ